MADDPLDFGIDLDSIRARLELMGYFAGIEDVSEASEALDASIPSLPPAAFVGVSGENGDPMKEIQGYLQRVRVEIAILFVESTSRFDRGSRDQLDRTRKAVTRQLIGWTPTGAIRRLEYRRFRVVRIGEGLAWGEVTFSTSYRLSI